MYPIGGYFALFIFVTSSTEIRSNIAKEDYTSILMKLYGRNGTISEDGFETLYRNAHAAFGDQHGGANASGRYVQHCYNKTAGDCHLDKCLDARDIFLQFTDSGSKPLDSKALDKVLPQLVYILQNDDCHHDNGSNREPGDLYSMAKVWGYGIGFVTLINVISNVGVVLIPIMNTAIFKRVLMFMVALSVGGLTGTALLVLIPESLGLMEENHIDGYLWKMLMVIAGIYVLYLSERIMTIVAESRKVTREKKNGAVLEVEIPLKDMNRDGPASHGHMHPGEKDSVATVAWMVLCGDGLHKFVDGLSIGAAFSTSVITGVTLSLAIVCEEVPHELGDIAVLVHSGLPMKKAFLYNIFAALFCYIGLVPGILLGETTEAARWIFGLAAGFFLYVALADLMPELNTALTSPEGKKMGPGAMCFLQNIGLLIGFGIIILMAVYASDIQI